MTEQGHALRTAVNALDAFYVFVKVTNFPHQRGPEAIIAEEDVSQSEH